MYRQFPPASPERYVADVLQIADRDLLLLKTESVMSGAADAVDGRLRAFRGREIAAPIDAVRDAFTL
jgi:hypothetical protein